MRIAFVAALVAAGLTVAAIGVSFARTSPNLPGRTVLSPAGLPGVAGGTLSAGARSAPPAAATASQAVLVPLPAGAVQIDSTVYDLQDMGSLGTRIVTTPDGKVHLTWQDDFCELDPSGCPPNLNAPQPYPQRGMGYAWRSAAGVWTRVGKVQDPTIRGCCLTELLGGFGTIAVTSSSRAAIAQHMNEDGCDLRGDFYLEDAPGGSTWTAYLTPIVSPSYLFPQVVALPNGSFVVCGEVPKGGQYDETQDFRISRLASAGTHFVCPTGWQCGPWTAVAPTSLYRDGKPAFPCLASASDGRAGIAVGDFGGNVYLIESGNGTFNAGTITIRNLTNYSDASIVQSDSTSTQYRAWIHCHLAYNDTTPHVVWSELQARKSGSTIAYYDWRSRIRHWDSQHGASTVKQVQAGEADHYDDLDNGLSGPIAGFNTLSVDWPQVGFSADGSETYVAWLRCVDGEIDPTANAGLPGVVTGVGFCDIACSVGRPDAPWSPSQNLTNTPSTDERFFSLAARNEGGRAHLVFQASATNQAGVAIIGDRGTSPGNLTRRIAYLERQLTASVVGVDGAAPAGPAALRSFPNPARGRVSFSLGTRARAPATLLVLAIDGRLMARLRFGSAGAAEWDGRDRLGHAVPSGVYLARLEGDPRGPATKFLLLH